MKSLTALLFAGILTLWVPDRWAVSLFQTGAFAIAMVWAARYVIRPFPIHGSPMLIPLAATILWGLAQLALGKTVYRWETWNELLKWNTNLVLFFLGLQIFSEPAKRERFLRAVLYFGVALSVIASIQMYGAEGRVFWLFPTEYKQFVLGPFVYHNQYAGFIELILPLAVVGALEGRGRLTYAAMAAALYASVIVAASRVGAILVTAEILVIVLVASRRAGSRIRNSTFALAALAVLFTAIAGHEALWRRFLIADPFAERRAFLQSSLAMIGDRPGMGFGLGTWSTAYPAYALRDTGLFANQAHNDWAQWTVEGGLPFLLMMLAIAACAVRPAFRSLWGIGVLAVFVHSLVDYPLQRPALAGFFFVFLAVMESASVPQKNS